MARAGHHEPSPGARACCQDLPSFLFLRFCFSSNLLVLLIDWQHQVVVRVRPVLPNEDVDQVAVSCSPEADKVQVGLNHC